MMCEEEIEIERLPTMGSAYSIKTLKQGRQGNVGVEAMFDTSDNRKKMALKVVLNFLGDWKR